MAGHRPYFMRRLWANSSSSLFHRHHLASIFLCQMINEEFLNMNSNNNKKFQDGKKRNKSGAKQEQEKRTRIEQQKIATNVARVREKREGLKGCWVQKHQQYLDLLYGLLIIPLTNMALSFSYISSSILCRQSVFLGLVTTHKSQSKACTAYTAWRRRLVLRG